MLKMISKGTTQANAVARSFATGFLVVSLAGCFLAGDEHNSEVEKLIGLDKQSLSKQLSLMSDEEKAALLISSWRRHPPSNFLNAAMAQEDIEFARRVTTSVDMRDSYVVVVEMLDFLIEMREAGSLSRSDTQSLDLQRVCAQKAPTQNMCSKRLNELLR